MQKLYSKSGIHFPHFPCYIALSFIFFIFYFSMCRDKFFFFFPKSVLTSNILFIAILFGDASGLEIT